MTRPAPIALQSIFIRSRRRPPSPSAQSLWAQVRRVGRAVAGATLLWGAAAAFSTASAQDAQMCDVGARDVDFLLENCAASCQTRCTVDPAFTFANLSLCQPLMTGQVDSDSDTPSCTPAPTPPPQTCDVSRGADFLLENCAASCAKQCGDDQSFMFANIEVCQPLIVGRINAPDTQACAAGETAGAVPPGVRPEGAANGSSPASADGNSSEPSADANGATQEGTEAMLEEEIVSECGPRSSPDRGLAFLTGAARDGVTPPECTVGRRHIICRFGVIQNHISELMVDFEPIKTAQYDSVTDETLCANNHETVLAHYRQSKDLEETVNGVNSKFDQEGACLQEVDAWLEAYECANPDGCSNLIDSVIRRFELDIKPTRDMRTQMNTDLTEVKRQSQAIEEVSGLYDFFCR